jgi:hypothetical protein
LTVPSRTPSSRAISPVGQVEVVGETEHQAVLERQRREGALQIQTRGDGRRRPALLPGLKLQPNWTPTEIPETVVRSKREAPARTAVQVARISTVGR